MHSAETTQQSHLVSVISAELTFFELLHSNSTVAAKLPTLCVFSPCGLWRTGYVLLTPFVLWPLVCCCSAAPLLRCSALRCDALLLPAADVWYYCCFSNLDDVPSRLRHSNSLLPSPLSDVRCRRRRETPISWERSLRGVTCMPLLLDEEEAMFREILISADFSRYA